MEGQLHFEIVEDHFEFEGFVSAKQKEHHNIDEWTHINHKTKKFIKVEPGSAGYSSNNIGLHDEWPDEDLQAYINLLLKSSMAAKEEKKKYAIFFSAKSYVTGQRPYGCYFRGMPEGFYAKEEIKYIEDTLKEAYSFFKTGKCSFATQDIKYKETLAV